MSKENKWTRIGNCIECEGDKWVKNWDGYKIQQMPGLDFREEHKKDCRMVPHIMNLTKPKE